MPSQHSHLVIVRGTQVFDDGGWKEFSDLDIIQVSVEPAISGLPLTQGHLQMLGRAGRPSFDTEGCAIIMTEMELKDKCEPSKPSVVFTKPRDSLSRSCKTQVHFTCIWNHDH